jgi:hypothetical protein
MSARATRAAATSVETAAIVADRPIPRAGIDAINLLIAKPSGVTKVVKTPPKFEWRFELELNQPKQLLVPCRNQAAFSGMADQRGPSRTRADQPIQVG